MSGRLGECGHGLIRGDEGVVEDLGGPALLQDLRAFVAELMGVKLAELLAAAVAMQICTARIVISREHERTGLVNVHFPRHGFGVARV